MGEVRSGKWQVQRIHLRVERALSSLHNKYVSEFKIEDVDGNKHVSST